MIKSLFTILLTFAFIFYTSSPSWSMNNDLYLEKNVFSFSESNTFDSESICNGNSAWIASVFFPGLGQVLMGDVSRGLKFPLIMIGGAILIVFLIMGGNFGGSLGGQLHLLFSFFISILFSIPLYIWNVVDAYLMGKDHFEKCNNIKEINATKENFLTMYSFSIYSF
ncbi:MAG: hypothetical protein ACK4IX_02095 [Candidatus Sericytochromatia bacterium]